MMNDVQCEQLVVVVLLDDIVFKDDEKHMKLTSVFDGNGRTRD